MTLKRRIFAILTSMVLVLTLVPTTAFAADTNGDGYDDGDVAIVQQLMVNSKTLIDNYDENDPASWDFINWQPGNDGLFKVQTLNVIWNEFPVTDYVGTLDLSGLDEMITVIFPDNEDLTAINLPNSTDFSYLDCSNTGVTAIDVSGYTNLQVLYCYNTEITALDVSKNPALEVLNCVRTGITELDVSNNPALKDLDVEGTGITSLDVSNNTQLESLSADETNLTELDVSKNPALGYLFLYDTEIKELDVSNNTALTVLDIPNTEISTLDVSNNTALYYLSVAGTNLTKLDVSKNTELGHLFLYDTEIKELDVSNNTKLEVLNITRTQIKELDISNNDKLEIFRIDTLTSGTEIKDEYTLSISSAVGGEVCVDYDPDTNVAVVYVSYIDKGYRFDSWSGIPDDAVVSEYTETVQFELKSDVEITATFKQNDTTLSELTISGVTLTPAFDKNVREYTVTVPNDTESIDIQAKVSDEKATLSGTGKKDLKVGKNVFTLSVTERDKAITEDYIITVIREDVEPVEKDEVIADTNDNTVVAAWTALLALSGIGMGLNDEKRKLKK